jgi:ATP-dependent Clp protease ATP-binding subunit ClpC
MESLGYKISVSDTAIDFICEKGYDIQFGARPLHRAVQKYIEDVVAEAILDAQGQSDLVIEVDFDEINQKTVASTSPIVLEEMSFFDEE